jgi:environmental stress-induced protein Ves
MTVRVVPFAAQRGMAWANGGGTTREVAIEPAAATAATCHWRVSVAQVASSGPFSHLPGLDRSLWLWRGDGVRLDVRGEIVTLARPLQRFDFAGETPIVATLLGGPCEDVNVMVSRAWGRATADVVALVAGARAELPRGAQRLALVLAGDVQVDAFAASAGDAVRAEGDVGDVVVHARTAAEVLLAAFTPHAR